MPRKKKNDIRMIRLTNGLDVICQYVSQDDDWLTVHNPVVCQHNTEEGRLQMTPLLNFGARDTDSIIPIRLVDIIYTPTDGLIEEYNSVFVEQTKDINVEEDETEVIVEEETVEV